MPEVKVIFVPRVFAEAQLPTAHAAVISITDPRQASAELGDGWGAVLRLGFHDIDGPYGDFQAFSFQQALDVLRFLSALPASVTFVMVHCEAGVSRSAAVALFVGEVFKVSVPDCMKSLGLYCDPGGHNRWVLQRLKTARRFWWLLQWLKQ